MIPASDGSETARKASHSRIYCDGSEHYEFEGDDPEIDFFNADLPEEKQLWVDDANGMVIQGKLWPKDPWSVRLPTGQIASLQHRAHQVSSFPLHSRLLLTFRLTGNVRSLTSRR